MNIEQTMSQPVITCGTNDTLNIPAQQMWEHDVGVIPVVDDDGKLAGIVTDRDICMAAYTQGGPLQNIPVSSAMAKELFSCRADDSLETAEHLMAEKQVRRLPIVDGENRPIGIVSMNDVARNIAAARKANGAQRELVQTMAAICEPRLRQPADTPQQQAARA